MQNTATQAIEGAFHRDLGRHGRSKRHGLQGTIRVVLDTINARYQCSRLSSWKEKNRDLREVRNIPCLLKFPILVQKLIVKQKRRALWRRNNGKTVQAFPGNACYCLFFRKYLVPCQHMFHHDLVGTEKFLSPERWDKFAELFEEGGMEVYAKHTREFVRKPTENPGESDIQRHNQEFQEASEMITNVFWRLQSLAPAERAEKSADLVARMKATCAAMSIEHL